MDECEERRIEPPILCIIPFMESSLIRIIALCGIAAVVAIVALAFGRWIADGFDAVFAKWRRLWFVGCVVSVAMVVVATIEVCKGEGVPSYDTLTLEL